jgi:heme/copper-type cytochrome/quinol oxidase subunit 4
MPENEQQATQKSHALQRNLMIGLILLVITLAEFGVAITRPVVVVLILISVVKTAFILRDFMHIGSLWNEGDEH